MNEDEAFLGNWVLIIFSSCLQPFIAIFKLESTGIQRDVPLTGFIEDHHRAAVQLSAEVLKNSEDLASHGDAEGNAQSAQKFRLSSVFAFLGGKAQGSCIIGSDSFEVKAAR